MTEKLRVRENWEGHQETELNIVWCFMNLATDREEFGKVLIANGVLDLLVFSCPFPTNTEDWHGRKSPSLTFTSHHNRCSIRSAG